MQICTKCVLPDTFPGVRLDKDGVCAYCLRYASSPKREALSPRYEAKFRALLDRFRGVGPYDVLLAYSGGKDSTYTLKVLRDDLHLRVIAVTFNNHFLSQFALENIRAVTRALDVAHLMVTPSRDVLLRAFRESATCDLYRQTELRRASAICVTCMSLAKCVMLRCAIEMGIPLIAYGWSPGQAPIQSSVMQLNPSMIREMQGAMIRPVQKLMGDDLGPFVLRDRHFDLLSQGVRSADGGVLYNIHPLAFLGYDEARIARQIEPLGWRPPTDTDANSTNCLLNSLAIEQHLRRFGFHPYAAEISTLVREGHISRQAGLAKLTVLPNVGVIQEVQQKLGLCGI